MAENDLVPPARLRVMQIIAASLPAGVVIMAGVFLFLVYGMAAGAGPPQPGRQPLFSLIAAGFFLISGTMSFIVPGFVTQNGLREIAARPAGNDVDAVDLLSLRQSTMIIGLALVEGACFFGLIAFFLEREPLVLVIPGLGLLIMFARFPTANSVREWIESQRRRVHELRQDRPSA